MENWSASDGMDDKRLTPSGDQWQQDENCNQMWLSNWMLITVDGLQMMDDTQSLLYTKVLRIWDVIPFSGSLTLIQWMKNSIEYRYADVW